MLTLVALTRFFHWAHAQDLCRENPTEDVSNIRLDPRQPQGLDNTDLRRP
jgi:site-specific recombinase XerD